MPLKTTERPARSGIPLRPSALRRLTAALVLLACTAPACAQASQSAAGVSRAAGPPPAAPLALRPALLYQTGETATFFSSAPLALPAETIRADTSFVAHPRDPWLGFDKLQHVTFGFLWTLGSQYALVNKLDRSEGNALPLSIGFSALVGLSKELYDWRAGPTRYFSKRDLLADGFGILLAAGLILL